ncbi:hypothetical protein [Streptomyces phaeochromogenes]|uniref:hypothetical protein n=1 Tax=Streptomyces phaeochromogenes TaxID=1923 RepID=UPI00370FDB52
MELVSLIATAVMAGAAVGLRNTVSDAVRDLYAGLKRRLNNQNAERLPAMPALEGAVEEVGEPESTDGVAAQDAPETRTTDPAGARGTSGGHHVTVTDSTGVVVGDHTRTRMTFNGEKSRKRR